MTAQSEKEMAVIEINSPITGYKVNQQVKDEKEIEVLEYEVMGEHIQNPDQLSSTRYKIKPRGTDIKENYYVIISDITLNEGKDKESHHPFEIFITSKDTTHLQWINALTLLISAVFRKGGDITFLANELQQVIDPRGGWFGPTPQGNTKFIPSMVSAIGNILQSHFETLGILETKKNNPVTEISELKKSDPTEDNSANSNLSYCPSCNEKALKKEGGCEDCLSCTFSRC